jgi:hypothetical protein
LKHGGLLQELAVHMAGSSVYEHDDRGWRPTAAAILGLAMRQAAGRLHFQSFTLQGSVAAANMLQQLPAAHLTQLHAQIDMHDSGSMAAVQALCNLRSLTLHDPGGFTALVEVACLQHLTQLKIGIVGPWQLLYMAPRLPSQLRQIDLKVTVLHEPSYLVLLARWLEQHGHLVISLNISDAHSSGPGWASAWMEVAAAFQAAGAAEPDTAAAAAAEPDTAAAAAAAPGSKRLQLQAFSAAVGESETAAALQQLLQHLLANSLTELGCCLNTGNAGQLAASPMNELGSLAALLSLHLSPCQNAAQQSEQLLAPLSALSQLAALKLHRELVRRVQLNHLQLPQLQQLQADVGGGLTNSVDHLQLGHLTALTQLSLVDATGVLSPAEQLPPNLQELTLRQVDYGGKRVSGSGYSLQPLLVLSRLQKLQLCMRDAAPAAEDLAALSSISSLTAVELSYVWECSTAELEEAAYAAAADAAAEAADAAARAAAEAAAEAAASAWQLLPAKALTWSSPFVPAAVAQVVGVLQGLTRLELHTEGTLMTS